MSYTQQAVCAQSSPGVTPYISGERAPETEVMEDQDIDPDIMNMVAVMCGDYSKLPDIETEK